MCWRSRMLASEAGVHRPPVAGIHGQSNKGAYSIVVSGGYPDDKDKGESIIYTGSGGRDLRGNKRVNIQTTDQTLTRTNAALARNCYSKSGKLDETKGGDAGEDWTKGRPIRVIRSHKMKVFGPTEGYRYEGIYKLKRYWPENGIARLRVWRYELIRDDPTPAPWTQEGKLLIKQRGLDGVIESNDGENESKGGGDEGPSTKKKAKVARYEIASATMKLIEKDERNRKLWSECIDEATRGSKAFFDKLAAVFVCPICHEIVYHPVTLACNHTACDICIRRSKKNECDDCPICRAPMGNDLTENKYLTDALESLIPGYAKEREAEYKRYGRRSGRGAGKVDE